jgi:hypothetical protein
MLNKTLIGAAALCAGALLQSGCGDSASNSSGSMSQPQGRQPLDTQQLLAMAQVTSETADPQAVGAGALMVADLNDETSDPLPVG